MLQGALHQQWYINIAISSKIVDDLGKFPCWNFIYIISSFPKSKSRRLSGRVRVAFAGLLESLESPVENSEKDT